MCVCVYSYKCTCMGVWEHFHKCAHTCGCHRSTLVIMPLELPMHFEFLRQCLSLAWSVPSRLGCLAESLRHQLVSASTVFNVNAVDGAQVPMLVESSP